MYMYTRVFAFGTRYWGTELQNNVTVPAVCTTIVDTMSLFFDIDSVSMDQTITVKKGHTHAYDMIWKLLTSYNLSDGVHQML